jgi:hypothetical protein
MWMPMHNPGAYSTYTCGEEFPNSSYNPSATFAWFPFGNSSGSRGAIVLEISDTWTGGPTP